MAGNGLNVGRISSIKSHEQRTAIDRALAVGDSYAEISRRYGVSLSAVGRYAIQQRSELARLAAGEPSATDLVSRLLRAADDARELREMTRGSAVATRVRAIKLEVDTIRPLLAEIGVNDETLQQVYTQTAALIRFIIAHARKHPDAGMRMFHEMAKDFELAELGQSLARTLPTSRVGTQKVAAE